MSFWYHEKKQSAVDVSFSPFHSPIWRHDWDCLINNLFFLLSLHSAESQSVSSIAAAINNISCWLSKSKANEWVRRSERMREREKMIEYIDQTTDDIYTRISRVFAVISKAIKLSMILNQHSAFLFATKKIILISARHFSLQVVADSNVRKGVGER